MKRATTPSDKPVDKDPKTLWNRLGEGLVHHLLEKRKEGKKQRNFPTLFQLCDAQDPPHPDLADIFGLSDDPKRRKVSIYLSIESPSHEIVRWPNHVVSGSSG